MLALTGAIGLLRYGDFFRRMHPPALAATLSAVCVTLASSIHFSVLEQQLALYPLLINALLAITTPVTTMLLARADSLAAVTCGRCSATAGGKRTAARALARVSRPATRT